MKNLPHLRYKSTRRVRTQGASSIQTSAKHNIDPHPCNQLLQVGLLNHSERFTPTTSRSKFIRWELITSNKTASLPGLKTVPPTFRRQQCFFPRGYDGSAHINQSRPIANMFLANQIFSELASAPSGFRMTPRGYDESKGEASFLSFRKKEIDARDFAMLPRKDLTCRWGLGSSVRWGRVYPRDGHHTDEDS